jgi:hypothetical protein
MSEQNRRLAGAIAAYGKSLDVNKNKRRPASASVLTERSTCCSLYLYHLVFVGGRLKYVGPRVKLVNYAVRWFEIRTLNKELLSCFSQANIPSDTCAIL